MAEHFEYQLFTDELVPVGELDGVISASVTGNVNRPIRWDGSLTLATNPGLDWATLRVRPIFYADWLPAPIPVGTFQIEPAGRQETYGTPGGVYNFDLYDRTRIPSLDVFEKDFVGKAGENVTDLAVAVLASTGETHITVNPLTESLRSDLIMDAGSTKLQVVNALLEAAGCFALHTNPLGQYQFVPYRPPQSRPIVARFTPNNTSAAAFGLDTVTEYPGMPVNKVVLVARGDGEAPDLKAIVTDDADFDRTGTWRALWDDGVEATSQAVLDQMARRRLLEARQATYTKTRTLAPTPLALNDVVADQDGALEVVEVISWNLAPGEDLQIKSREVKGTIDG